VATLRSDDGNHELSLPPRSLPDCVLVVLELVDVIRAPARLC